MKHLSSENPPEETRNMECQYFIQKTNNPRICAKKVPRENNFLWECWFPEYEFHYCNQHFKMLKTKIITQIEGSERTKYLEHQPVSVFYNLISNWNEIKKVQMCSILQYQIEEMRDRRDGPLDKNGAGLTEVEEKTNPHNCPICLGHFLSKKVVFLECTHLLCKGCLRKLQKYKRTSQKCPICRYPIRN